MALVLYVGVLAIAGRHTGAEPDPSAVSVWDLQDTASLLSWLAGLAVGALVLAGQFALIGLLTGLTVGGASSLRRRLRRSLPALLVGLLLTALVRWAQRAAWPGPWDLVIPVMGCMAGIWVGLALARGWRGVCWLMPQLLLAGVAVFGSMAWLGHEALAREALPFGPLAVTSAAKRALVYRIEASRRDFGHGSDRGQLRLSEQDLNLLLAWGLSLGSPDRKAQVGLHPGRINVLVSAGLPFDAFGKRYANIDMEGRVAIDGGAARLTVERLRVGRLRVPGLLVRALGPLAVSMLRDDPDTNAMLASVTRLRLDAQAVEVVYGRGEFGARALPILLARLGANPDVTASTRVQVEHLVAAAGGLPRDPDRFAAMFQMAFELAGERSRSRDPVAENRAAIHALAILLGDPMIETLIGRVTDGRLRRVARRQIGWVTLRGRADWTRHYCLSAALAVLSFEAASDAAGLLKEELDMGPGGSGFSFSDMLADRAGTRLAIAATRDAEAARAMQRLLARGVPIDDLFPLAADLPEGIPEAVLRREYGGVGGERYRQLEREIERRLDRCAALR